MSDHQNNEHQIEKLIAENNRLKKENDLKTGWISLISHDFKEAFASILMLIEALESQAINQSDFLTLLPQVKQDSQKNLRTITDTGNWIKAQGDGFNPILSEIYVIELFAKIKQEFRGNLEDKKVQFIFEGDETIKIYSDKVLITFILNKIVENAIKYSYSENSIIFRATEDENETTITIVDYGIGMNENQIENIYSFESSVFKGTHGEIGAGLSLKIVRNFVYLVQGNMKIESSENHGTTISILLPRT